MTDAEVRPERLGQVAGRAGQNDGEMSRVAMGFDQLRHRGEHERPNLLRVPLPAVLGHGRLVAPAHPRHRGGEGVLNVEQAELVLEQIPERARDVPAPGLTRAPEVAHVERSGVPLDERPIDVEQRGDGHGRSAVRRARPPWRSPGRRRCRATRPRGSPSGLRAREAASRAPGRRWRRSDGRARWHRRAR